MNVYLKTPFFEGLASDSSLIYDAAVHHHRPVRPNISILLSGSDALFFKKISNLIDAIEKNPIGKELINRIEKAVSSRVFIFHSFKESFCKLFRERCGNIALLMFDFSDCPQEPELIPPEISIKVALAHELIHCYRFFSDKMFNTIQGPCFFEVDSFIWSNFEEYCTIVGDPTEEKPLIAENAFRYYEGLPERFSHGSRIESFALMRPFLNRRFNMAYTAQKQTLSVYPATLRRKDLKTVVARVLYAEILDDSPEVSKKPYPHIYFKFERIDSIDDSSEEDPINLFYEKLDFAKRADVAIIKKYLPELTASKIEMLYVFLIDVEDYRLISEELISKSAGRDYADLFREGPPEYFDFAIRLES